MVRLNVEEQKRAAVLDQVDRGEMAVIQAAEVLGLSPGHVTRLLAKYRKKGPIGLAHGNRGRTPAPALDPSVRDRVVELAQTKYARFNHQRLAEKLKEEGISLSPSSVRRILLDFGIGPPGSWSTMEQLTNPRDERG